MIETTSCHFCSSRCGMLVNVEDSTAVKLVKAPCESACPVGIDVPRYMRFIGQGRFAEALKVIGEKVPLPGVLVCVCNHPCEKECQRGESDEALARLLVGSSRNKTSGECISALAIISRCAMPPE